MKSVEAQCQYAVTTFESPYTCFGVPTDITVLALNDLGQAAGAVGKCGNIHQPFVWTKERGLILLPYPEGENNGTVADMNNVVGKDGIGQVIAFFGPSGARRSYVFDDGKWFFYPGATDKTKSTVYAINEYSEAAGTDPFPPQAAYWPAIGMPGQLLAVPYGTQSDALDINNNSTIVGWMGSFSTIDGHAFRADADVVVDLGTLLPYAFAAEARSIDSHNVIGGTVRILDRDGQVGGHAVRLDSRNLTILTDAIGFPTSALGYMNDLGQALIVGGDADFNTGNFLWQHGMATRIEDLFDDPAVLEVAVPMAINNLGQFGGAVGTKDGPRAAIWTPINRPAGDVDCDCDVDAFDLTMLLDEWGLCPDAGFCACDLVTTATLQPPGDGVVNGADLAIVLDSWSVDVSVPFKPRRSR